MRDVFPGRGLWRLVHRRESRPFGSARSVPGEEIDVRVSRVPRPYLGAHIATAVLLGYRFQLRLRAGIEEGPVARRRSSVVIEASADDIYMPIPRIVCALVLAVDA